MHESNIHRCTTPTIVFLEERSIVELDFTVHTYAQPTALFLKKGQYFKTLDAEPAVFPLNETTDLDQYRYLFSHLTGIGHVLFDEKKPFVPDLEESLNSWHLMNPFNASKQELDLLFDTNSFIEGNLDPTLPMSEILPEYRRLNQMSSKHIRHTLHEWKTHKLIVQAKYLLFFAGKSIQEVAYELRFKDPAYFGRFFKRITAQTPGDFISQSEDAPSKYVLLDQLTELINENYKSHHFVQFYADRLNLTPKNLAEKVKKSYGLSVKQLLSNKLYKEASSLKNLGYKVSDIAHLLGFKEVSHFSAFFKRHQSDPESTIQSEVFVNS
ncbi:MAG: helix-turn-helix domain-containing protein [Cyclobacteriaceae bacterium]